MTFADKIHNKYTLINDLLYHIVSANNKLSYAISLYNDNSGRFLRHFKGILIESKYPKEDKDRLFFDDSSFIPIPISTNRIKFGCTNIGIRDKYLRQVNNQTQIENNASEFEVYNLPRVNDVIKVDGVEYLVIPSLNGKQTLFSFKSLSTNEYLKFDCGSHKFCNSSLIDDVTCFVFKFGLNSSSISIIYENTNIGEESSIIVTAKNDLLINQSTNDLVIESKIDSVNYLLEAKSRKICQLVDKLKNELYNQDTLIYAQSLHRETFLPYKGSFEGKEVCVVCTGPTAKYYKPMDNVIHIGINGAIYLSNVAFDIIFTQDYFKFYKGRESLTSDILNYRGDECVKFVGFHPPRITKRLCNSKYIIDRIPSYLLKRKSVKEYVFEYLACNIWAHDIDREPLGNYTGTVFSALQFVLYCHPSKIYLVGCDCSSGDFYTNNNFPVPSPQYYAWTKVFKVIVDRYYPDLNVTSINPVGLKGLFNDFYTEDYLHSTDFN